jgi:CRP/FNR family transcriptional regulator, dissimilatory nitrate respiration regulator
MVGTSSTRDSSASPPTTKRGGAARAVPAAVLLKGLPLFHALDPAALARLAGAAQRRVVSRGQRVFSRGDDPTGMYVLVFGEVRLLGRGRAGKQRLAGVVHAGESFGEPVMFLERPALVDAEAASDALLLHLPKEVVFAEIERSPLFARRVIAGLSSRLEALVQERERHEHGGGRARLADYLLRQADGRPDAAFLLPATKAAVAAHLRLTPEHFSRLLRELADDGVVRVDGRRITLLQPRPAAASPR